MRSRSKFIIGIMIFVILAFSSSVFGYKNLITLVKENCQKTTEAFKEEQFKVLWSSLNNLQLQSEKEISKISEDIEKDILALSDEDLDKLHHDMTNNIHNQDLHEILMKNIEHQNLNGIKNHRNGVVVLSAEGYMEDFNYRRANLISDDHESSFREWDDIIKNSYNETLERNAIEKLLNRTSGIIALESYDLVGNDNHIKIKEMNYESLLRVFLAEGMEGLRNYQIFVPYYITDIGDIFGTPDISQGIKVDNNKIIVVQEFNLYDQIMMTDTSELFGNNEIENIASRYNELLRWLYIVGIILVTGVSGLIFYFCGIYNDIIEREYDEHDETETPRTDNEMQKQS